MGCGSLCLSRWALHLITAVSFLYYFCVTTFLSGRGLRWTNQQLEWYPDLEWLKVWASKLARGPGSWYGYRTDLKPLLIFEGSINVGLFVHLESEGVCMFAGELQYWLAREEVKVWAIIAVHAHKCCLCLCGAGKNTAFHVDLYGHCVRILSVCVCVHAWLCVHLLRVHSASLLVGSINRKGNNIPESCERDVQWLFSVSWDYGSSSHPPFAADEFTHSHIFLLWLFTKINKTYRNILSSLLFKWWLFTDVPVSKWSFTV